MSLIDRIAESRIREGMERGEFDELPGRGRPLALDDLSGVPADKRIAYKVLKNAGVAPQEVVLRKEIYRLERLIDESDDEAERTELRRLCREAELRFALLIERRSAATGTRPR